MNDSTIEKCRDCEDNFVLEELREYMNGDLVCEKCHRQSIRDHREEEASIGMI